MDDTQQSRASDAATRKRRSSILKSQRPARTPFCELEFNVCTPTDTTKSRRVSFSRRTGVAEFATNEATTTWKNFYEEHNKSLESSGNDSEANGTKQTVAHLGKRLFDQQFEEIEAIDFTAGPNTNVSNSINNVNFTLETDKLSAPENHFELSAFTEQRSKVFGDDLIVPCVGEVSDRIDINFSAIQKIGESDDLDEMQQDLQRQSNVVCHGPFNGRQNMSEYIEVDLDMTHVAVREDESDMSITDMIHVPTVQDVSKSCSIDKKVNLDKDWVTDKENIAINPYVAPRESLNFAVNEEPDKVLVFDGKKLIVQTEKPTPNVEKVPQRKTIVLNCNDDLPNFFDNSHLSKNVSEFSELMQKGVEENSDECQKKQSTIIYDDDMCNISLTKAANPNEFSLKRRTVFYENDTGNISVTQAVPVNIIEHRDRTVVYDNANISVTKAISGNIILTDKEKTVVYENDCDISETQALPANIIGETLPNKCQTEGNVFVIQAIPNANKDKRRTIVYDNDTGNISITQAIPSKVFIENAPDSKKTIVFEDNNVSMTKAVPAHIIAENRELFMEIDQLTKVPTVQDVSKSCSIDKKVNLDKDWVTDKENIAINPYVAPRESLNFAVNEEPDKVLVFDGKKLIVQTEKPKPDVEKVPQRKTIVLNCNDDLPNFFDNSHLSKNVSGFSELMQKGVEENSDECQKKQSTIIYGDDMCNISLTKAANPNELSLKRRTVLYENDTGNISVTQAVPVNIIEHRDRTVVYDNANISVTKAISGNIILTNKEKTVVYENDCDISETQAVPANIIGETLPNKCQTEENVFVIQAIPNANKDKRRTIVYDNDTGNISITQAIPSNVFIENASERRRTVVFENDTGDISVTQAVPSAIISQQLRTIPIGADLSMTQEANKLLFEEKLKTNKRSVLNNSETGDISVTRGVPPTEVVRNISDNDTVQNNDKRRTVVFDNEEADISVTQAVPLSKIVTTVDRHKNDNVLQNIDSNKRRTVIFDNENADISVTMGVPANQIVTSLNRPKNDSDNILQKYGATKRRTVVIDNENADISVTMGVPANQIVTTLNQHNNVQMKYENKRKTVVFDNEEADILSVTQGVILNQFITNEQNILNKFLIVDDVENKRKTILNQDNTDRTMAQANNRISNVSNLQNVEEGNLIHSNGSNKRKTIVFNNDDADISMTEAVDSNKLFPVSKTNTEEENIQRDIEEATKIALHSPVSAMGNRRKTIVYKEDDANISMTQAIPANIILAKDDKRQTIVFEDNNVSMTKAVPAHIIAENRELFMEIDQLTNDSRQEDMDISMADENQTEERNTDTSKGHANHNATCSFLDEKNLLKCTNQTLHNDDKIQVNDVLVYQATISGQNQEEIDKDVCKSQQIGNDAETENEEHDVNTISTGITSISPTISQKGKQKLSKKESNESDEELVRVKHKKSILTELLDMSSSTTVAESDKEGTEVPLEPLVSNERKTVKECTSNDTLFYITSDTRRSSKDPNELTQNQNSPIEIKPNLESKLTEIKSALKKQKNVMDRHYEKNCSPDKDNKESPSKLKENTPTKGNNSFKTANDTNELLDLLSDFTDKRKSIKINQSLKDVKDQALENEETAPKPRTLNVVPRRKSIALSREDLFHNLSMATAALQKSRMEMDESENCEDSKSLEDTKTPEKEISPKKVVRLSSDVVKTLHFEDESVSDISDTKQSPLKKTAFGEISYMKEVKSKVIPDYMKGVSEGIKELMDDLVKPNADVLPYDSICENDAGKEPSTCSTQIQANLIASSQIDLTSGLCSEPESVEEIGKISSADIISDAVQRSVTRAMTSPISKNIVASPNKSYDMDVEANETKSISSRPCKVEELGQVLIFDPTNPLNNINLAPPAAIEVHKYNPLSSEEISADIDRDDEIVRDHDNDRVTTQYRVESKLTTQYDESQSNISTISKTMSIDRAIEAKSDVVETEVNTVIAMKGNKELLEASSSLTLVDDALMKNGIDEMDTDAPDTDLNNCESPVRVIYKGLADAPEMLDSDFTSNDEENDRLIKAKKRMYSPAQRDNKHIVSKDITPKPISKMQKISSSPLVNKLPAEKEECNVNKSPKKLKKKGTSMTVQQFLTEYNVPDIDRECLKSEIKEVLTAQASDMSMCKMEVVGSAVVSSCTSSNNMRDCVSEVSTQPSSLWPTEEVASNNELSECDSGVNVVSKIDMLPFMGSPECEWESSSGDIWSFLLLHSRVRLTVRLAHTHRNSTRTLVRADTRVTHIALHVIPQEKSKPLATLCVRFASETMQWALTGGCSCAGQVPTLLRKLAAVARLAGRWTTAMHCTQLRLAYTLSSQGRVSLKVANIPLRTVWEVTMHIELSSEENMSPFPRASSLQVRRVLDDVCAELPHSVLDVASDWGHVPTTIWRVFKYLKNRTAADTLTL